MNKSILSPVIFYIYNKRLEEQVYADPIKKLQEEMYQQLLVLREGLYHTVDLSCASASSSGPVASAPVSDAPMTAAQLAQSANDETKILKDENAKLKYRIGILLNTIDEIEKKK